MERARHESDRLQFEEVINRIEAAFKRSVLHIGLNGDFTFEPDEVVAEMDEDGALVEADKQPFVNELAELIKNSGNWIPPEYCHKPASGTLSDENV